MIKRNQGAERHVRGRDTLEGWYNPERNPEGSSIDEGAAKAA